MWLPLNEYSHKFNISISTLRRRIKAKTIKFKLQKGKYLLWADEESTLQEPLLEKKAAPVPVAAPASESTKIVTPPVPSFNRELVDSLLEEKEKRIELLEKHVRLLHQEIDSLQSLVKMLEA